MKGVEPGRLGDRYAEGPQDILCSKRLPALFDAQSASSQAVVLVLNIGRLESRGCFGFSGKLPF